MVSESLADDTGFWNPALDFMTLDDLGDVSLDEILNWALFVSLRAGLVRRGAGTGEGDALLQTMSCGSASSRKISR